MVAITHPQVVVHFPLIPILGRLGSLCWLGQMGCKHRLISGLHLMVRFDCKLNFLIYTFYNSEANETKADALLLASNSVGLYGAPLDAIVTVIRAESVPAQI